MGLDESEYLLAIEELVKSNIVIAQESWVFIIKAPKHNRYWMSESNHKAVFAELEQIPQPLQALVERALSVSIEDSTVYTTVYSGLNTKIENLKAKKEIRKEKEKSSEEIAEEAATALDAQNGNA